MDKTCYTTVFKSPLSVASIVSTSVNLDPEMWRQSIYIYSKVGKVSVNDFMRHQKCTSFYANSSIVTKLSKEQKQAKS